MVAAVLLLLQLLLLVAVVVVVAGSNSSRNICTYIIVVVVVVVFLQRRSLLPQETSFLRRPPSSGGLEASFFSLGHAGRVSMIDSSIHIYPFCSNCFSYQPRSPKSVAAVFFVDLYDRMSGVPDNGLLMGQIVDRFYCQAVYIPDLYDPESSERRKRPQYQIVRLLQQQVACL